MKRAEILMPVYSTDAEILEERQKFYYNKCLEIYPNMPSITLAGYNKIKTKLELGNTTVLSDLFNKSITVILKTLVRVFSKYDIEEKLSFEDVLSYTLVYMQDTITNLNTLPRFLSQYTSTFMSTYVSKIVHQCYSRAIIDEELATTLSNQNLIWESDKVNQDEFQYETIYADDVKERFLQILHIFTPRTQKIMLMRFGFINGSKMTYEEIAKKFGITRGAVAQIIENAIKKLQSSKYMKLFEPYQDGISNS